MIRTVRCASCSTSFPVDPRKVPEEGVYARCSVCDAVFFVDAEEPSLNSQDEVILTSETTTDFNWLSDARKTASAEGPDVEPAEGSSDAHLNSRAGELSKAGAESAPTD